MNLNSLTFKTNVCYGMSKIVLDPPDGISYTWTIQFDILNSKLKIFCNGKVVFTKRTIREGKAQAMVFDTADTISTHYRLHPGQESLQ